MVMDFVRFVGTKRKERWERQLKLSWIVFNYLLVMKEENSAKR